MDTDFQQWTKVLVYLYMHQDDRTTFWNISRQLNIPSTSSISNVIQMLATKNLLRIEHVGRVNKYILTEKGLKIAENLNRIFIILK